MHHADPPTCQSQDPAFRKAAVEKVHIAADRIPRQWRKAGFKFGRNLIPGMENCIDPGKNPI